MTAMFYSLDEVMDKLNKTKEQIEEIVKQGILREFRDGHNLLFKVDEVSALITDADSTVPEQEPEKQEPEILEPEPEPVQQEPEPVEEELSLAQETEQGLAINRELTEADTIASSEEIDIPSETKSDLQITDDVTGQAVELSEESALVADEELSIAAADESSLISSGETSLTSPLDETVFSDTADLSSESSAEPSLEEIEEDINLDTFGSGSGLLDLSLQADDTSLGGILDEIYTPEGEEQAIPTAASGSEMGLPADAEQMLADVDQPVTEMPVMAKAYVEPKADLASNTLGFMLVIPLLAIIYIAIVVVSSITGARPVILTSVQHLIWYIVAGAGALVLIMLFVPVLAGDGGTKTAKKAKPKEEKKVKAKKEKKPKKEKKKKK